MIQQTLSFGPFRGSAAKLLLAVIAALVLLETCQSAKAQQILEEYVLPTGSTEGEDAVYQVLAGQLGVVPASGYPLQTVVETLANAGFEAIEASEEQRIIIAKPRTPAKNYAELSEQAALLMAEAGEVVQWTGPVVRTKDTDGVETQERGDILIPTDVVIVKIREDIAETRAMELAEENALTLLKRNPVDKRELYFQLRAVRPDLNVFTASRAYAEAGISEYATPNFYIFIDVRQSVPNDPLFNNQWPLDNTGQNNGLIDADIDADLAWDFGTGNSDTVIAVIDGGFDMTHPDLVPNFFVNAGEEAGNGLDDDANGYVDDRTGWDFVPCWGGGPPGCGDNDPTGPDTREEGRHGTMTAGAAAAAGNNSRGVTGTCPDCALLPLRIQVPLGAVSQQVDAFGYAQLAGADIITNSWGYRLQPPATNPIVNAISNARAAGSAVFFAMSTTNRYEHDCISNDISSLPDVIGVSASNNADTRTPAGYGDCMDILAPTDNFLAGAGTLWPVSTDMTGTAGYNSDNSISDCISTELAPPPTENLSYTFCANGTSYAAPLIAGISGLMESLDDTLTPLEHQRILQDTSDKIEPDSAAYNPNTGFSSPTAEPTPQRQGSLGGAGSTHGYGRVNAFEAVRLVTPTADGGHGRVDAFLRDNNLDWGNTEQPSNVLMDNPRGFIPHYQSPSIKIDAPPYEATEPITPEQFADFPDENPRAEATNKIYVLVRNRGLDDTASVTVKLLWVFAGTALPALPSDFWDVFPADSAVANPWTVIGTRTVAAIGYSGASIATQTGDGARVVSFDFTAPALDPSAPAFRHYCLFGVIDSADDPVSDQSRSSLVPDVITPNDNNITHRNISLQDPSQGGSFTAGLNVRNPYEDTIQTRLIIDRPANWTVSLKNLRPDDLFNLPGGSDMPFEVRVDRPGESAIGEVEIRQEVLRSGNYEPLGGFLFRFTPNSAKQSTTEH